MRLIILLAIILLTGCRGFQTSAAVTYHTPDFSWEYRVTSQ